MTNATLYLNDVALGCVQVDWPEPVKPEPMPPLSFSFSWSGRLSYRNGKKARRDKRQLHELLTMGCAARRYVRLYRSVKQHQLRKRQLVKRR